MLTFGSRVWGLRFGVWACLVKGLGFRAYLLVQNPTFLRNQIYKKTICIETIIMMSPGKVGLCEDRYVGLIGGLVAVPGRRRGRCFQAATRPQRIMRAARGLKV